MAGRSPLDREQPRPRAAKPVPPYFACDYDPDFHPTCIQAMANGIASPEQAQAGLKWILEHACAVGQQTFMPGEPDGTAFFAGRVFAGQQIKKMLALNVRAIQQAKKPAQ